MNTLMASTSPVALTADALGGGAAEDEYLSEDDTARFFGVSPRTVQRWRRNGTGPFYTRLGQRRVVYHKPTLIIWAAARTFRSTSEEGACHVA
jgi:hypothetical protein